MKIVSILCLSIVLFSCSKEKINTKKQLDQPQPQFSLSDPVIDAYSPFGEVSLAPDDYVPYFDECINYVAVYLFIPSNGPWSAETIEIYRYNDEEDISGACGDEFNLTKTTGTNANGEYVYCETPASNCYEGSVDGRCVLVFCDEE